MSDFVKNADENIMNFKSDQAGYLPHASNHKK